MMLKLDIFGNCKNNGLAVLRDHGSSLEFTLIFKSITQ